MPKTALIAFYATALIALYGAVTVVVDTLIGLDYFPPVRMVCYWSLFAPVYVKSRNVSVWRFLVPCKKNIENFCGLRCYYELCINDYVYVSVCQKYQ